MGRHLPHRRRAGRARGPGAARAPTTGSRSTGRRTGGRLHRHHPARAAARLRGPGRPPRRRALPAAVRHDCAHAAVRRRGSGPRPPAGRPRQGHRHRDGLHLRRPDRRHLVARAAPADPRDPRPGRPRCSPRPPAGVPGGGRYAELAGTTRSRARQRIVELLRESGDLRRRAAADHPPGEVLREGRPAAGDRHHPAVVHPQRRPGRRAARRAAGPRHARSHWTPTTCGTATTTGSTASTATG